MGLFGNKNEAAKAANIETRPPYKKINGKWAENTGGTGWAYVDDAEYQKHGLMDENGRTIHKGGPGSPTR